MPKSSGKQKPDAPLLVYGLKVPRNARGFSREKWKEIGRAWVRDPDRPPVGINIDLDALPLDERLRVVLPKDSHGTRIGSLEQLWPYEIDDFKKPELVAKWLKYPRDGNNGGRPKFPLIGYVYRREDGIGWDIDLNGLPFSNEVRLFFPKEVGRRISAPTTSGADVPKAGRSGRSKVDRPEEHEAA